MAFGFGNPQERIHVGGGGNIHYIDIGPERNEFAQQCGGRGGARFSSGNIIRKNFTVHV